MVRDGHRCAYCGGTATTVDHVLPQARGGENTWLDTVAACGGYNHRKGDRTPAEARMPVSGLNLVVILLRVRPPWGGVPIAVPVNARLHRKKDPTSTVEHAEQMLREFATWLPDRDLHLCADGAYASLADADLPRTHAPAGCAATPRSTNQPHHAPANAAGPHQRRPATHPRGVKWELTTLAAGGGSGRRLRPGVSVRVGPSDTTGARAELRNLLRRTTRYRRCPAVVVRAAGL
jgi:hypothetical protein